MVATVPPSPPPSTPQRLVLLNLQACILLLRMYVDRSLPILLEKGKGDRIDDGVGVGGDAEREAVCYYVIRVYTYKTNVVIIEVITD